MFFHARREFLGEVLHQQHDIIASIAKRRHHDRKHVQSIVEVAAKLFFVEHDGQIAIRGGDDSGVGSTCRGAAYPLELAVLQHSQKLGLELERDIANLVKKERASSSGVEAANPRARGAGECPAS